MCLPRSKMERIRRFSAKMSIFNDKKSLENKDGSNSEIDLEGSPDVDNSKGKEKENSQSDKQDKDKSQSQSTDDKPAGFLSPRMQRVLTSVSMHTQQLISPKKSTVRQRVYIHCVRHAEVRHLFQTYQ